MHPFVDVVDALFAGLGALEAAFFGPDRGLQWTAETFIQITALQEWRGALWERCHGSQDSKSHPDASELQLEPCMYVWERLRRSLGRLLIANPEVQVC